jgi:hypothetical protein
MRLFVTGGSGFIGGALVSHLVAEHEVWAMARSDETADQVERLGATAVRCDLASVQPSHLGGVDAVVHCAAIASDWAPPGEFDRVNTGGTKTMLAVSKAAGVRRFVHMSSDSVLFAGRDLRDMNEDTPYPPTTFPYARSKQAAEKLVVAATAPQFETVCVRPVLVWGPNDKTVLPELVELIDRGAFAWVDGGRHRVSTTHVANVVHGTVLALERGRSGGVYFLTDGPPVVLADFFTRYLATVGREPGDRSVPGWLLRALGASAETVWRIVRPGVEPPLSREAAATLSVDITVSSNLAADEIGYRPVIDREQGLQALGGTAAG